MIFFIRMYLAAVAAVLLIAIPARAEKLWTGQVPHSAILGESFSGAKVIIGSITGKCATEFGDLLRKDLIAHDVAMVRDEELSKLAGQHHIAIRLPLSGAAPELARLLGVADVISVEISECYAMPRQPMIGEGIPALHIARTEGHFRAALHATDLANGNEIVLQNLRAEPFKEIESPTAAPEYPGVAELTDTALRQGIEQTRRLYSPWTEEQHLTFMDDEDCNLRQAWEVLRAGDYFGLVTKSRANAESCTGNARTRAAAWYDLGAAYMLVQNYVDAIRSFESAGKLRNFRQTEDLIAECRRNRSYSEALARQVIAWDRHRAETKMGGPAATGIIFTNGLVIRLVQGGVAEEDIVKLVRSEPNRFALDAESIEKLKQVGVPENVVAEMIKRGKESLRN